MTGWWDGKMLMRCQVDEMAIEQNSKLTEMEGWQNDSFTKWQVDKMANWQNDNLTKRQFDSFTKWQVDEMAI